MTLIKTSLFNVIAVGVRMLTLLWINKILAVYVGPSGYAALGQFQNAVQMITTLASGGINTGVTKYTAEYHENEAQQNKVWQTAGTIALCGSFILSVLVFIYRDRLAVVFFKDERLSTVFVWFAAALVFFVFNTLILAILNGKKDIHRYVLAHITGSILSLIVTTILVMNWGLLGALIALATYQAFAFFATLFLCSKTKWFHWRILVGHLELNVAKNLAKYTVMALTSAITVPLTHLFIREHLATSFGLDAAGHWEAMWRLSAAYLMLATTTLSVYYLPKFAELTTWADLSKEIISGYKLLAPITIACLYSIYLLQDLLIVTLFSIEFLPMKNLFFWQLIGDFLKISSWLLAYVLLARVMMWSYIILEIIASVFFYFLTVNLSPIYGLEATTLAHTIAYVFYLACLFMVLLYFGNKQKFKQST